MSSQLKGMSFQELFTCCQEGRHNELARLLKCSLHLSPPPVNQIDGHGRTPLYHACRQGHTECAGLLIAACASINQCTLKGNTPLLAASHHGHLECARMLLSVHAQADYADNDGYTPLLIASRQGYVGCTSLLLEHNASVDCAMTGGFTPLFAACNQGHDSCVRLLLENFATVDMATSHGTKPLLTACQLDHLDCVKLLLVHGAKRDKSLEEVTRSRGNFRTAQWLASTEDWSTPLHYLDVLQPEHTRRLLRDGADIHACVRPGAATPLSVARELVDACFAASSGTAAPPSAQLVLRAAEVWSPNTHHLFPLACRERAVELLVLGYALAQLPAFVAEAHSLSDVWTFHVMPHVLQRGGIE